MKPPKRPGDVHLWNVPAHLAPVFSCEIIFFAFQEPDMSLFFATPSKSVV